MEEDAPPKAEGNLPPNVVVVAQGSWWFLAGVVDVVFVVSDCAPCFAWWSGYDSGDVSVGEGAAPVTNC